MEDPSAEMANPSTSPSSRGVKPVSIWPVDRLNLKRYFCVNAGLSLGALRIEEKVPPTTTESPKESIA